MEKPETQQIVDEAVGIWRSLVVDPDFRGECAMSRLVRVEIFAADEIAVVHVMNRTVRRCFLMGKDPLTGPITSGS